jgi:hypothetical protein
MLRRRHVQPCNQVLPPNDPIALSDKIVVADFKPLSVDKLIGDAQLIINLKCGPLNRVRPHRRHLGNHGRH